MTQVYASATLQGRASTVTGGDLFQEVAASASGDADATGALGGTFTGSVPALGSSALLAPSRVDRFTEAAVAGDGVMGITEPLYLVDGPAMVGESSTVAPAELLAGIDSDPAGDAATAGLASVLLQGGSGISGDAVVGASASSLLHISGLADPAQESFYSVLYDGTDEYANVGDTLDFDKEDAFSISCWAKTTATTSGMLVAKLDDGPGYQGYQLYLGGTGALVVGLINTLSDLIEVFTTPVGFNDGQWHHFVMAYTASTETAADITLYVDGTPRAKTVTQDSLSATIDNSVDLRIGARQTAGSPVTFDGLIDEVAIYGKALSGPEVTWLNNGGIPTDLADVAAPSNLVAWWRMGDGDTYPTLSNQVMGEAVFPTIPNEAVLDTNYSPLTKAIYFNEGAVFTDQILMVETSLDYLSQNHAFSVGLWVNYTTAAGGILFNKYYGGGPYGWYVRDTGSGTLRVYFRAAGQDIYHDFASTGVNDGRWHHVLFTFDGSANISGAKLYLDGVELTPSTTVGTTIGNIATTSLFGVGKAQNWGSYLFEGKVLHWGIWTAELTPAEAVEVYGRGYPQDLLAVGPTTDLKVWLSLGDGSTHATRGLPDLSGNSNEGTWWDSSGGFTTDVPFVGDGTMTNMLASNIQVPVPWSKFSQYSYQFDGSNEYITMGDVLGFEYTDDFSLSCWVRTTDSDSAFLGKQTYTPEFRGYFMGLAPTGEVNLILRNDQATGNRIVVRSTTAVNDGDWHHVVATWKGNASPVAADVHLYVDGLLETPNVVTDNLSATILNSSSFNVAARDDGSDAFFAGFVTDVAIYDAELDQAAVTWIYNSGEPRDLRLPAAPSDLVAYWRLGEGGENPQSSWTHKVQQWQWDALATKESTTITDASPLASPGTLYNMVAGDVTTDTPGGISDYSCTFDGVSKAMYSNVASSIYAAYRFANNAVYSVAGWVKCSSGTSGWLWGNGTDSLLNWAGYGVYLNAGKPQFVQTNNWISGTNGTVEEATTVTVDDDDWHHVLVCMRYDTAAGDYDVKIYIDGVSVATTRLDTMSSSSSIGGLGWSVGARGPGQHEPVDAQCDEVAVWAKFLTQADATALYNSGAPTDLRDHKPTVPFLRGWWRMGDAYSYPGSTVAMEYQDKIGTAPGPTDYTERSLYFDGSNDYLSVDDASVFDFDITDPFSVSTWVLPWGASAYRGIVAKGTSGAHWKIEFYYEAGSPRGLIRVILDGSTAGLIEVYVGDRQRGMPFGQWLHLVVTYDGSNDASNIKAYLNGEEWPVYVRYNTPMAGTMINSDPLWIGRATSYLGGFQDETSIWDKELDQADVTELFNGGDPADLSTHTSVANLVGWWRLGEAAADATMVNMESGDIVLDAPYVPAGGGSSLTARANADNEGGADISGDASIVAGTAAVVGAAVAAVGQASVSPHAIVRRSGLQPGLGPEELVEQLRYTGFQPDRTPPVREERLRPLTDPGRIKEQNRSAPPRTISVVRRDTGSSSTPKK